MTKLWCFIGFGLSSVEISFTSTPKSLTCKCDECGTLERQCDHLYVLLFLLLLLFFYYYYYFSCL
uniref:Uncharacterized protein n=1 Tax=Rhizophora mucronata TaxID=61149 RepID=A0A2P2JKF1_RHIMU